VVIHKKLFEFALEPFAEIIDVLNRGENYDPASMTGLGSGPSGISRESRPGIMSCNHRPTIPFSKPFENSNARDHPDLRILAWRSMIPGIVGGLPSPKYDASDL
jgi:hypothetical protein